jgi:hypothetical protein
MHLNHHFPFFFFPSAISTAVFWPAVEFFKNEYDTSTEDRPDVLVNLSPKDSTLTIKIS